tara:strand:+ start:6547 stop:7521 length:975 start_codon:yes stop_codon:yes gene_type:complete
MTVCRTPLYQEKAIKLGGFACPSVDGGVKSDSHADPARGVRARGDMDASDATFSRGDGALSAPCGARTAANARIVFDDVVLGRGSQGTVKLGDVVHNFCAVKEGSTSVLRRELIALKHLNKCRCPSVVLLYAHDILGPQTQLFMELAVCDLFTQLDTNTPFDKCRALDDLVNAMVCFHSLGVVHGDVKLENILLMADQRVKYCDWGLVQSLNDTCKVHTGSTCYMSPQKLLHRPFNNRIADWWALGIVSFVLLCGNLPFERAHHTQKAYANFKECGAVFPVQTILECYAVSDSKLATSGLDIYLHRKVDAFFVWLHEIVFTAST